MCDPKRPASQPGAALLAVILAVGCHSGRDAELAAMSARLEGNCGGWHEQGPSLDFSYWVDEGRSRKTTVRQKLIDLGARLRDREVVDPQGRVLYFMQTTAPYRGGQRFPMRETPEEVRGAEWRDHLETQYRVIRMYIPIPKHI